MTDRFGLKTILLVAPLPQNQQTIGPLLARTRPAYPAFWGIGVTDAGGRVVAADPATTPEGRSVIGVDLSDRAWFRETVEARRVAVDRTVLMGALLRNARLCEETRAREREATKLYETTRHLTASLDVEAVMDQIVAKSVPR